LDEEVGTTIVDERGVDKINGVAFAGSVVTAGFPGIGVDADSVANKFEVGVGEDIPKLQARSKTKIPIQKKSRLVILRLN
jgi:hypothetical protein